MSEKQLNFEIEINVQAWVFEGSGQIYYSNTS